MMGIYLLRLGDNPRHERRLTAPGLEAWAPDWSPDASKLLFSSNINRPNGAIYTLTQGPNNVRQLTHPPFPLEDWSAMCSPEADQIVFTSDRLHPDRQGADLFTMRADGTHLQPIKTATPNLNRYDPQWGTASLQPTDTAPAYPSATSPSPQAMDALRQLCNAQRALAPAAPCAVSSKSPVR